jgi:hypothetical protein
MLVVVNELPDVLKSISKFYRGSYRTRNQYPHQIELKYNRVIIREPNDNGIDSENGNKVKDTKKVF